MMRSIFLSLIFLAPAVTMPAFTPLVSDAQEIDSAALRRKQYTQQQAQALTRRLVSQVLDLQAAQLRQNGLVEVPIYNDILQMRENLDELIGNEMQGVVQKLVEAQEVDGQQRINAITQAQDEVRKVLLTLMAERQRLYRRMRLARLHAQVRELITVQEKVSTQTRELPQLPMQSRDEAALANLSRQTDAVMMFHHLEEALLDMRSWGGSLATSAITGQQVLKDNHASEEVQQALASIREGRFSGASVHQDAFVAALYKILEDLQKAQGLADNSLESAMNEIEKLKDQQQELKEETSKSELTPEKADQLSQQQESIQKKLEELAKSMTRQPENAEALEEASQAAADAVAELFEADQEEAIEKQEDVLAKLDTLKEQLLEQAVPPNVASADQREQQIAALENAQQDLQQALETQTKAEEQFEKAPQNAEAVAQMEREAGQQLDSAAQAENLPEAVKPMIAEAKAQANEAAAAAEQANSDNQASTEAALEQATDATRQALENVSSELADAKRQQLATKIGELARAAEALDRAAAAQQEISRDAAKIANDPQQSQNQDMEVLAQTQSDIAAVANRVAEGTKNTAPQAAEAIAEAQQQVAEASKAAQQMAKPQQSAEATGKQAQQLQADSREAQQQLNQAANALRQAAKEAAQQLAQTAGDQLDQIDSVDEALGSMPSQQDMAAAQAQMESLANEAGMISPEAAARLRQQPEDNAANNPMGGADDANNPADAANGEMANDNAGNPSSAEAGMPEGSEAGPAEGSDPQSGQSEGNAAEGDSAEGSDAEGSSSGESAEGAAPMEEGSGAMEAQPMNASNTSNTPEGMSAEQMQNQVQQARAELAGRRQPIAADKKAAEAIADLLENVSGSSEKIQELSQQLMESNGGEGNDSPMGEGDEAVEGSPEGDEGAQPMESGEGNEGPMEGSEGEGADGEPAAENPIASQLAQSMMQFAQSQRKATQLAANAAQQGQIANQPVREALQTASRLPTPMLQPGPAPDTSAGETMPGEASAEAGEASGEPAEGSPSEGSPSEGSPMGGNQGEPANGSPQMASQQSPGNQPAASQPSADMGNSMVSPTPQVTAQALAGSDALESLWDQMPELFADGRSESNEVATIDPMGMAAPASAMLDEPQSSQSQNPTDAMAQNAMQGQPTNSQQSNSPPTSSTEAMAGSESQPEEAPGAGGSSDSNPASRAFEKEPWFTKLPPGVQQSIRASVRRSPPPGYEERLRRYFENID
ncbi:hypothetical protein AB1L30_23810 [Bremerella sp. JC817]|uniref:hypothetical protein n=1 Tax=Bremerella sp. JC817 TaxID=3231756 RepID=UPI00345ADC46